MTSSRERENDIIQVAGDLILRAEEGVGEWEGSKDEALRLRCTEWLQEGRVVMERGVTHHQEATGNFCF